MIIGLNGRLKSGKDTTYGVIKDMCPWAERVSFADPLKNSAAAAIGLDRETLEELKGREDLFFSLHCPVPAPVDEVVYKFNVRQYLQWYGTEAHREIFGDDFWVDQALPLDLDHSERLIVVTDMRFPNEAQRVKDIGGVTVRVMREVGTGHAAHPSEQNIDHMIDKFLDNEGNLDDLKHNVLLLLLELGVGKNLGSKYAHSS